MTQTKVRLNAALGDISHLLVATQITMNVETLVVASQRRMHHQVRYLFRSVMRFDCMMK